MNGQLNWYSARIILESILESADPSLPQKEKLFEDRIFVFRAPTDDEARLKAEKLAQEARHEYRNEYGETVSWVFRDLLDVKQLFDPEINDGTEVYSALIGEAELENLKKVLG
jgi:hypothetical protein